MMYVSYKNEIQYVLAVDISSLFLSGIDLLISELCTCQNWSILFLFMLFMVILKSNMDFLTKTGACGQNKNY